MLYTVVDRSPLEWRWQKPSTSIFILSLRMRLRYPLMHLRRPTRGRMPVLDSLVLCEDEVYKVLLNLDPSKAPGPDGLPTIVLKTCARELTHCVCALFNLSLAGGKLPTEWKDALVVPIHKKGKKEDATSYRPVSLLCVVSKVLERCIFNYFKDFLCPLFDSAQHGFLQGRSTVTQLLAFFHEIGQSLDKGLQSDIVYLDLAKAFDRLPPKVASETLPLRSQWETFAVV